MLRIIKRPDSPFWQIVGTCPYTRERVRKSTGVDREEQAKQILAAFLARRHTEAVHGPQSATLVAEAVLEYVDKGGDARFLGPILDNLGKRRMIDVADTDLSDVARKAYPGAQASTLVRQLYGPFQAVWNAAERARMVPPRKIAKPKVKRKTARYASPEYQQQVMAAIRDPRQFAAVAFMTYSGARASEVVNVLVRHYDRRNGTVLIQDTKNGTSRTVPLPPSVERLIQSLDLSRPESRLFGYAQRFALNNILRRASERAGLAYMSPHKFGRHTFAARILSQGHSLKTLQEAGGWKSANLVVTTYAHIESSVIDAAVRDAVDVNTEKLLEASCRSAGSTTLRKSPTRKKRVLIAKTQRKPSSST